MFPVEPTNKGMKRYSRPIVIVGAAFACFAVNFGLILTGHYRAPLFVLVGFLIGIALIVRKLPPVTTEPQQIRANQLKAASSARLLGCMYVAGLVLKTVILVSRGTQDIPQWGVPLMFGWGGFLIWTFFRLAKRLRRSAATYQSNTPAGPSAVGAPACRQCQSAYINDEAVCRVCRAPRYSSQPENSLRPTLVGLTILATVICITIVVYLNIAIVRTEAFKNALTIALSSPTVRRTLGDKIHTQSPVLGHLVPFGKSKFMEWSVRLKGSSGHGHLYGVANEINGTWDFSRLTFESDDHVERVELTPVRKSLLPPVPGKHVYLIPLGLDKGESLEWAPDYYRSKFGIEATVLSSVPPEIGTIDTERNQIVAEKCVDSLREKYPQLARDPSTILIALTSSDLYIRTLGWRYAQNFRTGGRFAVISSARIHPPIVMERANHEWLNSRLEKLLTKNLAILYFDLPLSNDYTSVLSSGVLSGLEIDEMGNSIIGGEGYWDPFVESGTPSITIFDVPGKDPMWNREYTRWPLPDTTAQLFSVDLGIGLLVQRKTDFIFEDEPALQFSRVYRTQDELSRAFGIGGTDSFDMFLVGQMGVAIDLILDDGSGIHYVHSQPVPGQRGDVYAVTGKTDNRFFQTQAIFLGDHWEIKTGEGWTYFFPYTPKALPQYVTVLTSFTDPAGRKYEMTRDSFGALLEVRSPSGKWLRFENDSGHRIQRITSSTGRSMRYEYDDAGGLARATDSEGHVDSYTYDEKGEMLTAGHADKPVLVNEYLNDGYIKKQVIADDRTFKYFSSREANRILETQVVDPNGLETYIQYVAGGFTESLPQPPPPGRNSESPKIDPDVGSVMLPDGSKFKTAIYGLKVIGQLRTRNKLPYYIMSGTTCTECDEDTSIYIHSPSDGPMKNEGEQPRFSYPGENTDYESGQVVYEGRMFYGDCLSTHPNAAVWFDRTVGDDKKWHDRVLVAEVKRDRLATTVLHRHLPKPSDVQPAVRTGQCHELRGMSSSSEP